MIAWNNYHQSARYNLQERIAASLAKYDRFMYDNVATIEEGLFNDFTSALYLVQNNAASTWHVVRVMETEVVETDTGLHDKDEAKRFCTAIVQLEGL